MGSRLFRLSGSGGPSCIQRAARSRLRLMDRVATMILLQPFAVCQGEFTASFDLPWEGRLVRRQPRPHSPRGLCRTGSYCGNCKVFVKTRFFREEEVFGGELGVVRVVAVALRRPLNFTLPFVGG